MLFHYNRTIRFQETDAAGVVYFANLANLCHEAYEASLQESGIVLKTFFAGSDIAAPVTHVEVDFFRPLYCGDRIRISLAPKQLNDSKFEIVYAITVETDPTTVVSRAITRHVCIDPTHRTKVAIPPQIQQWLQQFDNQTYSH